MLKAYEKQSQFLPLAFAICESLGVERAAVVALGTKIIGSGKKRAAEDVDVEPQRSSYSFRRYSASGAGGHEFRSWTRLRPAPVATGSRGVIPTLRSFGPTRR